MQEINKKVIKAIAKQSINDYKKLGEVIAPFFFRSNECALLLNIQNKTVEVLSVTTTDENVVKFFYQLTELLSILHDLNNNHLIYVLPQEIDSTSEFYYQKKTDYSKSLLDSAIKINSSNILKLMPDGTHSVFEGSKQILKGYCYPSVLYDDLMYFFNSIVYPTSGLNLYIKHYFYPIELYETKRSNKISKISIIVAILIALLSPFVSVLLNNKYGVCKLNENQYKELIQLIK